MKVNLIKCALFKPTVEFLGFLLKRDGYQPTRKRIDAILRLKEPRNIKGVRMFLGTINFIKNHIPGRAGIMEPITRLTNKEHKEKRWR